MRVCSLSCSGDLLLHLVQIDGTKKGRESWSLCIQMLVGTGHLEKPSSHGRIDKSRNDPHSRHLPGCFRWGRQIENAPIELTDFYQLGGVIYFLLGNGAELELASPQIHDLMVFNL